MAEEECARGRDGCVRYTHLLILSGLAYHSCPNNAVYHEQISRDGGW